MSAASATSGAAQRDLAVYIGRFEPFHAGHLALLQHALALAPRCVLVIGSAFQARTPKNPWTWQERAEMVRLALAPADRERVSFLPVRDYYDEAKWIAAVRRGVAELGLMPDGRTPRIALVGHFKDPSSDYLRGFGGWEVVSVERAHPVDASPLRDALFAAAPDQVAATLAALAGQTPPTTIAFLEAWCREQPFLPMLAEEWRALRDYHAMWAQSPFPPVFVTVDSVVRCAGHVLLIRRGLPPGKGLLAAPGGFIEQHETTYQSAVRELREETGLDLATAAMRGRLRAVAVFDHPERSQRGRVITHAHFFDLGDVALPAVHGSDDARTAGWVPIADISRLEDQFHDDHFHMLDHFFGVTLA